MSTEMSKERKAQLLGATIVWMQNQAPEYYPDCKSRLDEALRNQSEFSRYTTVASVNLPPTEGNDDLDTKRMPADVAIAFAALAKALQSHVSTRLLVTGENITFQRPLDERVRAVAAAQLSHWQYAKKISQGGEVVDEELKEQLKF